MKTPRILRHACSATLAALLCSGAAGAQITIHVPGDQPTIQGGIDAAVPGDTVFVAPGTYTETIDFLGKAIRVESSGGPTITTIDGGGAGSVVSFVNGETLASVLRGFTITGGTGSTVPNPRFGDDIEAGGGILCLSSEPTIEFCFILGNTAADAGGGLYCDGDAPTLSDCRIELNQVLDDSLFIGGGGGMAGFNAGFMLATGCTIVRNSSARSGGGILSSTTSLFLEDTTVASNAAAGAGGGVAQTTLTFDSVGMTAIDCRFVDNTAGDRGGGIFFATIGDPSVGSMAVTDCRIARNTAGDDGGGVYAGVSDSTAFFGASARLTRTLVIDNHSDGDGGGAWMREDVADSVWRHTTFSGNTANGAGSAINAQSTLALENSIVWAHGLGSLGGSVVATYSDIEGGLPGTGNISADPQWVDPLHDGYCPAAGSPAVDAGDPLDPADPDGSLPDMGYAPTTPFCDSGRGLDGVAGLARLSGSGTLLVGDPVTLTLDGGVPAGSATLLIGASAIFAPFKGGTLVPALDFPIFGLPLDGNGDLALAGPWPTGVPAGVLIFFQYWMDDAAGPAGFSASNGLILAVP